MIMNTPATRGDTYPLKSLIFVFSSSIGQRYEYFLFIRLINRSISVDQHMVRVYTNVPSQLRVVGASSRIGNIFNKIFTGLFKAIIFSRNYVL